MEEETASKNEKVVAIGSDHAGFRLKEDLKDVLAGMGYRVSDLGTDSEESCDYPDFALAVAESVKRGDAYRGVLVCGTGAGMAIAANKVPGVRAVACNELYTAEFSRLHNDANVITMGSRIIDAAAARDILKVFLETGFEGEADSEGAARHARRLEGIRDIEREYWKES